MPKYINTKLKSSPELLALSGILGLTLLSGLVLVSSKANADNDTAVDNISIEVPVSCTMSGTGQTSHEATLLPGTYSGASGSQYQNGIGTTTLTTFCNDNNGFSIYAIGYSDDTDGNNTLIGENTSLTIPTKVYEATDTTSNWSMKVNKVENQSGQEPAAWNPENMTITNSFGSWHTVPDDYTKVAEYKAQTGSSATDTTLGGKVTTTYASFISTTQAADTYEGQVKYVMVHPYDHTAPVIADAAILDTGKTVNAKLKSLAYATVEEETPVYDPESWENTDEYIKSINVHTSTPAPAGFIPTEVNTISTSTSEKPIYIIFDYDHNDEAGIMHLYTEASQIALSADSSYMFYEFYLLSDLSAISDWDTTNVTDMSCMFAFAGSSATTWSVGNLSSWNTDNVTDMSGMFNDAGSSATTWSVGDLSSWNTGNVTDMSHMFEYAGQSATTWSIGDLSSWNTDNVTDMSHMFDSAGVYATTFSLDLSSWNTANVTDMECMFEIAGYYATTFTLDLSSWNTANVTEMGYMFDYAGYSATTWSVTIPQTNGDSINNTTTAIYGQDTSTYGEPDSGKFFTLVGNNSSEEPEGS